MLYKLSTCERPSGGMCMAYPRYSLRERRSDLSVSIVSDPWPRCGQGKAGRSLCKMKRTSMAACPRARDRSERRARRRTSIFNLPRITPWQRSQVSPGRCTRSPSGKLFAGG